MTPSDVSLILWDVDHTLVDMGTLSRTLYVEAFRRVTGIAPDKLPDMAGRTERDIIVESMAINNIPLTDSILDGIYAALGAVAYENKGRMQKEGRCLPGVRDALAALDRDGVIQSVVTGNLRAIAMAKLEALHLAQHMVFDVGGYGDDGLDRAELVRLAQSRARAKCGTTMRLRGTVVIGDTPRDIKGALDAHAYGVGVATGLSSAQELSEAGADVVFEDLADSEGLRNILFGQLLHLG